MLLAFFDSEGIVHHEYAPDGQIINKEFYLEVLRRLRVSVRRKRPEKWRDGDWILQHENAPTHTPHILCSSFWPKMVPLSCSSRHTPQISHRVTLSYSQGLRKFWQNTVWSNGEHQIKFDEDIIRHPETGVRKMFPTVAARLGEVCSCGRELCWRQLRLKPRKLYLLHVLWSVRIPFEQTLYVFLISGHLEHLAPSMEVTPLLNMESTSSPCLHSKSYGKYFLKFP